MTGLAMSPHVAPGLFLVTLESFGAVFRSIAEVAGIAVMALVSGAYTVVSRGTVRAETAVVTVIAVEALFDRIQALVPLCTVVVAEARGSVFAGTGTLRRIVGRIALQPGQARFIREVGLA